MTPLVAHLWCVRAKLRDGKKRYGSYPAGSLEKFRLLMGVHITDPVLHVCGGLVRYYPYPERAIGPNDKTLDLDPDVEPDFLQDAREPYPTGFKAIIADPDYSGKDADHRPMGRGTLPSPRRIVELAIAALEPGRRVGILHTVIPRPPKNALFVAKLDVSTGFDNRGRMFSVFERES